MGILYILKYQDSRRSICMRVRLLKNFRKVFHCHNFRMSNDHSFTFNNAVLVVDNLGQGSQAVGGARGV